MIEYWKPIPGADGWYEASSLGRIRSWVNRGIGWPRLSEPHIKSKSLGSGGYEYVSLVLDGQAVRMRVHILVAMTFLPNPESLPYVCHWNDNPTDNRLSNLRWGTEDDNGKDRIRNGRTRIGQESPNVQGEKQHLAKLTEDIVKDIREEYGPPRGRGSYRVPGLPTAGDLAKKYGVNPKTINSIVNRKTWRHI